DGCNLEHVVHACWLEKIEGHRSDHKRKARRFALDLREQRALIRADEAEVVGTPPLHEAQIIGVIDDATEVGVLGVDTHRHHMAAVTDLAVEAGETHSSSSPAANKLNCEGSRAGSTRPRWRNACAVSSRPRGVR